MSSKKTHLITCMWSWTTEVELPAGTSLDDIESATPPEDVDEAVCRALQDAAEGFRWQDLVVTDLQDREERESRMNYKITVQRIEHREQVFEVAGATLEEAENNALEEAGNHDFRQNMVCHAEEEVVQVVEVGGPPTKRIWIGGETGVVERKEDLHRAAAFEQKFSDEFNRLHQPVYVSSPEENGDPWTLSRDNYDRTEVLEYPGEYNSEEAAWRAADAVNNRILDNIAAQFPCIDIPADWNVQISNAARGKYPKSRSCRIYINDDAGKIHWEARGAADTWIPKPLVADYIRAAVRDAENKTQPQKNNAD